MIRNGPASSLYPLGFPGYYHQLHLRRVRKTLNSTSYIVNDIISCKRARHVGSSLALEPVDERCGSTILKDFNGVERTASPFCSMPLLHTVIMNRLYGRSNKISAPVSIAYDMLMDDFLAPGTGPQLRRAWSIASSPHPIYGKPEFRNVRK